MIPLLPFVAGLVAGGLAVRAWRSEETRAGVRKAQDALLSAAQSGMATLRTTTGELRQRLVRDAADTPAAPDGVADAAPKKPRRKASATTPASAPARKTGKAAAASVDQPAAKRKPATRKRKPAADTTTDA